MHTSLTRFVGTVARAAVAGIAVLGIVAASSAFGQEAAIQKQVRKDVRGEDLEGRDGPFAKLGSDLAELYRRHQRFRTSKDAGATFEPKSSRMPVHDGRVTIDFLARNGTGASLENRLRKLGAENVARRGRLVSAQLPISALSDVAALQSLHTAEPSWMMPNTGSVTSQGDVAMRADVARSQNGFDGTGVKVGVLSDSYDKSGNSISAQDDINSGDLPPEERIDILDDSSDPPLNSDEGRAMMQIVHDIAPGAELGFHTATTGRVNFAQGILDLAFAGCGVITDDIIYFSEPMFQEGVIAEGVEFVAQNGVSYFSAVGNNARQSFTAEGLTEGDFIGEAGPNNGALYDFDGSGDTGQEVTIPAGAAPVISFQWTDPYGSASPSGTGPDTDLNIFLKVGPDSIAARSEDLNAEGDGGDPVEVIGTFTNPASSSNTTFDIVIECTEGCSSSEIPERMTYVYFGDLTVNEYANPGPTGYGHVNATKSASVAAAGYFDTPEFGTDPPVVESYSSEGGIPIYFNDDGNPLASKRIPKKPDVTGPDLGNTTFFGSDISQDSDSDPNFPGTSAAAPHVAGVAALIRSKNAQLTPTEVYSKLEETAIDMDDPATGTFDTGYDYRTGHGFVQADQALQAVGSVSVAASVNRSFGSASGVSDYRLVSLPGKSDRLIGSVIDGEAGSEWQAFRDNGRNSDFLKPYDGSDEFRFENGNGFWLISTQDWTVNDVISTVDFQGDAATVPLQSGWNIISNPLDKDVSWSTIKTENGVSNPIWAFNGTFTNVVQDGDGTFDSAKGGEAFYFKNDQGLSSLTIPYPSGSKSAAVTRKNDDGSTLTLSASKAGTEGPSSTVRLGLSAKDKAVAAPPRQFETVSLRIATTDTSVARKGLLMTQQRSLDGDGETFDLELTSQGGGNIDLTAAHVSAVKAQSVALVHPDAGRVYDLRADKSVTIKSTGKTTDLKILVGTQRYVETKTDDLGPSTLTLTSYPNPMRDQGTVEYELPASSEVQLVVYDLLGRRVATLAQGTKKAGRHAVKLDASRLTSGVYFVRLRAAGQTRTQKIVVVK